MLLTAVLKVTEPPPPVACGLDEQGTYGCSWRSRNYYRHEDEAFMSKKQEISFISMLLVFLAGNGDEKKGTRVELN
jgi:hypothetical protein